MSTEDRVLETLKNHGGTYTGWTRAGRRKFRAALYRLARAGHVTVEQIDLASPRITRGRNRAARRGSTLVMLQVSLAEVSRA